LFFFVFLFLLVSLIFVLLVFFLYIFLSFNLTHRLLEESIPKFPEASHLMGFHALANAGLGNFAEAVSDAQAFTKLMPEHEEVKWRK
jgi:hypothetical protein